MARCLYLILFMFDVACSHRQIVAGEDCYTKCNKVSVFFKRQGPYSISKCRAHSLRLTREKAKELGLKLKKKRKVTDIVMPDELDLPQDGEYVCMETCDFNIFARTGPGSASEGSPLLEGIADAFSKQPNNQHSLRADFVRAAGVASPTCHFSQWAKPEVSPEVSKCQTPKCNGLPGKIDGKGSSTLSECIASPMDWSKTPETPAKEVFGIRKKGEACMETCKVRFPGKDSRRDLRAEFVRGATTGGLFSGSPECAFYDWVKKKTKIYSPYGSPYTVDKNSRAAKFDRLPYGSPSK